MLIGVGVRIGACEPSVHPFVLVRIVDIRTVWVGSFGCPFGGRSLGAEYGERTRDD
jgi:hypothetical protein